MVEGMEAEARSPPSLEAGDGRGEERKEGKRGEGKEGKEGREGEGGRGRLGAVAEEAPDAPEPARRSAGLGRNSDHRPHPPLAVCGVGAV